MAAWPVAGWALRQCLECVFEECQMCSEPFRAPFAAVHQALQTVSMPCCQLAPMHLGLRQCTHNGLTGPCILGIAHACSRMAAATAVT